MIPRWLVLVGIAATLLVSGGDVPAKRRRPVCPGGRFVVHERPLLLDPTVVVDGLTVQSEARLLSVRSGCPVTRARLKGTKKGFTRVRARWASCNGLRGKVRIKARIDKTCRTITGKIRAPRSKFKRKFVATLPACGDGIYDAEGGEQCDAGRGCGRGQECKSNCTCGAPGPGSGNTPGEGSTTTTTISGNGGGSTTLPAADLAVSVPVIPGFTGEAGHSLEFTWTVTNVGGAPARAPWNDAVYLSSDDLIGPDDGKLADFRQTRPLPGGVSYRTTADLQLPLLSPGFYYLIVRTDDKNVLPEPNETNNEQAVVIEITVPELEPSKLDVQPRDGGLLEVTWQVKNNGDAPAHPPWHDALFVSTDAVLDDDDLRVAGNDEVRPLERHGHTPDRIVTIPMPVPGSYIILVIDEDDSVFESREDNNVRARELHDGRF